MSLISRFFGRDENQDQQKSLIANPDIEEPLSLQVLFSDKLKFSDTDLTRELRAFDRVTASAACERDETINKEGYLIALVGWDKHVIRMVGFNLPMPKESFEPCIVVSPYPQELKEKARNHKSHVILYYAGYEPAPLDQYVALATVAGVLYKFGAIVVMNETAYASFPAGALAAVTGDKMSLLRFVPLLLLYCGFVKYEVDGVKGIWMRTYGAHLLGIPDLAILANGYQEGQLCFDMFTDIFHYMLESGAVLGAGHTMQVGKDTFIRLREPKEEEYFLESDGKLYVTELITEQQINRYYRQ
jgi:hypothetical protein